jgi:hypothetical protein
MAAAPAPVAPPAHLVRRKTIDVVLAHDRRFRLARANRPLSFRRNRRQWCCLRAYSQRGRARDKSKGEFQKVAAFHHIPPLQILGGEFRRAEMNAG